MALPEGGRAPAQPDPGSQLCPHQQGLGAPAPSRRAGMGLRQEAPCWEQGPAAGVASLSQQGCGAARASGTTVPTPSPSGAGCHWAPFPGALSSRGTRPKILARLRAQGSPKRRHLLPPAGTVPPGEGRRGEICTGGDFSADRTHAHTHTHTIECNRTQCKNQFHAHTIRLCKAHTLQYSRRSGGQGGRQWLRYCTGVNVNNKASSERASRETRTAALYRNALKTTRSS